MSNKPPFKRRGDSPPNGQHPHRSDGSSAGSNSSSSFSRPWAPAPRFSGGAPASGSAHPPTQYLGCTELNAISEGVSIIARGGRWEGDLERDAKWLFRQIGRLESPVRKDDPAAQTSAHALRSQIPRALLRLRKTLPRDSLDYHFDERTVVRLSKLGAWGADASAHYVCGLPDIGSWLDVLFLLEERKVGFQRMVRPHLDRVAEALVRLGRPLGGRRPRFPLPGLL